MLADLKVAGRYFRMDIQPADISIPVVVGRDILSRAKTGQPSDKTISELFLTDTARAFVTRRRAKDKTVLIIGSYLGEGISRIRKVEGFLWQEGYEPVVIADFPSGPEPLETEFLSFALMSRFVLYESSIPSGAIDEYKICKDNRIVTAVLHEEGKFATSMQDYEAEHTFIRVFPYTPDGLKVRLREAIAWAEEVVDQRKLIHEREIEKNKYR